jgi:hypothetical protein
MSNQPLEAHQAYLSLHQHFAVWRLADHQAGIRLLRCGWAGLIISWRCI